MQFREREFENGLAMLLFCELTAEKRRSVIFLRGETRTMRLAIAAGERTHYVTTIWSTDGPGKVSLNCCETFPFSFLIDLRPYLTIILMSYMQWHLPALPKTHTKISRVFRIHIFMASFLKITQKLVFVYLIVLFIALPVSLTQQSSV